MCPCCEQDKPYRLRFRGRDGVYVACLECDAMWDQTEMLDESSAVLSLGAFCRDHDLVTDDIFWIDLPCGVCGCLQGLPSGRFTVRVRRFRTAGGCTGACIVSRPLSDRPAFASAKQWAAFGR